MMKWTLSSVVKIHCTFVNWKQAGGGSPHCWGLSLGLERNPYRYSGARSWLLHSRNLLLQGAALELKQSYLDLKVIQDFISLVPFCCDAPVSPSFVLPLERVISNRVHNVGCKTSAKRDVMWVIFVGSNVYASNNSLHFLELILQRQPRHKVWRDLSPLDRAMEDLESSTLRSGHQITRAWKNTRGSWENSQEHHLMSLRWVRSCGIWGKQREGKQSTFILRYSFASNKWPAFSHLWVSF